MQTPQMRGRGAQGPTISTRFAAAAVAVLALGSVATTCSQSDGTSEAAVDRSSSSVPDAAARATSTTGLENESEREGVYAYTTPSDMSEAVVDVPARVYVPNSKADTVDVIDPSTFEVIDHFPVGNTPHHITPSWDLKTLYVDNTGGNSLTPIDPVSGKPGPPIPVDDPYNLYFTLDGEHAIVVAERYRRLDFRDPETWELQESVEMPCRGPDHLDFDAEGTYLLISCEFDGQLVKVDLASRSVVGQIQLGELPIDVRLSPDGEVFYVADQGRHGVSVVDGDRLEELAFIPTGQGAHGLYPSRDAEHLYVTNRLAGTISVIDFATRQVVDTWEIGGSPDMGGVSPDGTQFWITGRYHASVYVVDTRSGELIRNIPVGTGAHGLAFFPQPGRFSLGHTGNYR